jgi:hypothetical protein
MLRAEGIDVSYDPPEERRDAGGDLHIVVLYLVCNGSWEGIRLAVAKFRERFAPVAARSS